MCVKEGCGAQLTIKRGRPSTDFKAVENLCMKSVKRHVTIF